MFGPISVMIPSVGRCRDASDQRTACTRSRSKRQWAGSSYRIRIQQNEYLSIAGDRCYDGQ